MRVRVLFFLISYYFHIVSSHTQLQAKIELKKNFNKNYLRDTKPASIHFDIELPPSLIRALGYMGSAQSAFRAVSEESPTTEATWSRGLKAVPQLMEYLIEKSRERFEFIIENFSKKLITKSTNVDLTHDISATISNYKSKLNEHVIAILKDNPQGQVETDVIWLDIIETSSNFIYNGSLTCLQIIIDRYSSKLNGNVATVKEEIFKKNFAEKNHDLRYLCKMIGLCRSFPAFSDYLADLIGQTIRLPDNKMHYLIMKSILIFKEKYDDVLQVLGKSLVNKLERHLQDIVYGDLTVIRKALFARRIDILERNYWKKISVITKAFRLLLDMTNKAFDFGGKGMNDVMERFITIMNAMRDWSAGRVNNNNIGEVEHAFLSYIVTTLIDRWVNDTNKEVRALVHFIIDGKADDKQKYQYLLVNGSNYVNNN